MTSHHKARFYFAVGPLARTPFERWLLLGRAFGLRVEVTHQRQAWLTRYVDVAVEGDRARIYRWRRACPTTPY